MSAIALNLDPAHTSVCNNAAWSAGEIALKVGAEMKDFIPMLAKPLVEVMNRANVRTLLENTARQVFYPEKIMQLLLQVCR